MNDKEKEIYKIIQTSVCSVCPIYSSSECYNSRCIGMYEEQARAIYLKVVQPLEEEKDKNKKGQPRTYRKLPIEVSAIQWTGTNIEEVRKFCGNSYFSGENPSCILVINLNKIYEVHKEDFIVKDNAGNLYPCRPDTFAQTYTPV